ncbi:uncharacterized protein Z518_05500 [Rhinocladiella mackenziei CBS 650.93]|uniref:DNA polymerase n=1 Tax=Rhinocladiella mackenziei CBS 650.93 TaxID=1442369 RepID=A0A0D2J6G1_9EURO|nr:uncharacterized protein Z518_05500 [Rhinocladiella mackenziei CBS 650.93]KIX04630.1 hypothetical protein Z518_05500 [Rhinocladiella mackenziei CBS 650.93]
MAFPQEKRETKEKDQFFRDLYQLDHLDDDQEGPDVIAPMPTTKKPVQSSVKPFAAMGPAETVMDPDQGQRKRKLGEDAANSAPKSVKAADSASLKPRSPAKKSKPTKLASHMTDLSNLHQRERKLPRKIVLKPIPSERQIFKGLVFYFIPNNDDCPVRRFRMHKAVQYGAIWAHKLCEEVTHILVCDGLSLKDTWFREVPKGPAFVTIKWFIECLEDKEIKSTHWKRIQVPGSEASEEPKKHVNSQITPPRLVGQSHNAPSPTPIYEGPNVSAIGSNHHEDVPRDDDETESEDDLDMAVRDVQNLGDLPLDPSFEEDVKTSTDDPDSDPALEMLRSNDQIRKQNAGFQCMEKNDGNKRDNPNDQTIELLRKMVTYYDRIGDHWRTTAYRKAIGALRKQTQMIRTHREALAIPQIGERIASKIEEIVSTGRLRRLEYAQMDSKDKVLQLFMGIYGVGYSAASRWIAQGHRTLEDLCQKVDLTPNQRTGIEHYEDFQQRIPRNEVAQHGAIVEKALKAADAELRLIIGGSYRRGSPDSGDIDLIITKEDADLNHIRTLMVETVIPDLLTRGFLKVALASGHSRDQGSKWHGASALPGSNAWRRIDLLFVPWAELGAALIYFTGNDIFNRSMRLLASRKKMRLNQRGLYADVMRGRGRERITDGRLLEGQDEKRIFEILGVPYRPPEHRQC